jgi:hypothetical protein
MHDTIGSWRVYRDTDAGREYWRITRRAGFAGQCLTPAPDAWTTNPREATALCGTWAELRRAFGHTMQAERIDA